VDQEVVAAGEHEHRQDLRSAATELWNVSTTVRDSAGPARPRAPARRGEGGQADVGAVAADHAALAQQPGAFRQVDGAMPIFRAMSWLDCGRRPADGG